ncbi:PHP domain-containing protein [candidate division WOR-3 bacterium]|nr:PHP domain-containing protein [candidate division WOR-3 bacterium]
MTGIFHIHTSHSFDATISSRRIVDWLQKLGVDFAAITDHETIQGALEVRRLTNNDLRLTIIVGAEYYTDKGDIIGLFLEREVKSRKSNEVIKEIKAQGGIVVLPHPYKSHKLDEELIKAVDVIEVFNARTSENKNVKALALARKYGKPGIAASDAHFLQEIGLTRMEFGDTDLKKAILNGEGKIIKAEESQLFYSAFTGLTKLCKTKDPRVTLGWIKKLRSLLVNREL